jgi:osmotically-inducible protein OsmY
MQGAGSQGYGSYGSQGSSGQNYGMQGRAQQYGIGNAGNQGFPGSNFPDQDMRDQGWSGGYGNQGYGGQSDWRGQGRNDYGMYGQGNTGQSGNFSGQGTQGGRHFGKGPKGYQRSDERIREEVSDRMTEHGGIDASELEVQVSNGEVTLTGFVDDRQQKRMAEDLAEQISGVRDVHNQLRVHEHGQSSTGNESESTTNGRTMARTR